MRLAALGVLLLGLGTGAQIPVKVSIVDEEAPAASGLYLMWAQNSRTDPLHYDVYVQRGRGPKLKVNAPGTQGWPGGISGRTIVYQEITGGRSDLRFFDLVTHKRRDVAGVNTAEWEAHPSLSEHRLLFARIDFVHGVHRIVLHDLRTGRERTLGVASGHRPAVDPGQINGKYAVWTTCEDAACQIWRADLAGRKTTRFPGPNPYAEPQYGASVTPDGTVYFGRSGLGCGARVQLMRAPPRGPSKVLLTFPRGQDFQFSSARADGHGRTSVFYDRATCADRKFDIYKIVDSRE